MMTNDHLPGIEGFVRALGIQEEDHILILTDSKVKEHVIEPLASAFQKSGKSVTINKDIPLEFTDELPDALYGEAMGYDVLLFMASQSWYHTTLRKDAKYQHQKRVAEFYAPNPSLYIDGAMTADFHQVEERGNEIAKQFRLGEKHSITGENGTDLSFLIETISVESGLYDKPGSGGNLPAGEVSLGVRKGTGNGRIVFDLNLEIIEKTELPVTLEVVNGLIVSLKNNKGVDRSDVLFPESVRNIAEVGIGINERAIPGRSILEDEKVLGTAHIGIGSNIYFGGDITGPHYDGVFLNPQY